MRIGAAQRELSWNNGERFLAPVYACITRAEWLRRYRDTVLPKGAQFGTRVTMGCGGFEHSVRVRRRMGYTWSDFWTIWGRSSSLFSRRATRSQRGPYDCSWCLQVPVASAFSRGVQRNVDDSRDAAVISWLSRRRRARQFSGFLGSPPWTISGRLCVLGSVLSLGCSWCFLRLDIFIFLFGLLKVFWKF